MMAVPGRLRGATMIPEEDFDEAQEHVVPCGVGSVAGWSAAVASVTLWASNGAAAWLLTALGSAVFTAVCVGGFMCCQRTIKAWRDQKRLEIALRDVEKMGGVR
jgi:hypothetical protein